MSAVFGVVIMLLAMSIIDIIKHDSNNYYMVKISHLVGEITIILITIYYYTH